MSDDERMDRARRIRELREGNRRSDDDDDAANDETADPATDAADGSDSNATADENDETEPADEEPETTADSEREETVSEEPAGTAEDDSNADPNPDEPDSATEEPATGGKTADGEQGTADSTASERAEDTDEETASSDDHENETAAPDDAESDTTAGIEQSDREGEETPAEDDDALATAQAVAAAASEFEGEGGVTMDPETAEESADATAQAETAEDDDSDQAVPAGATVAEAVAEQAEGEETRVLEFRLGDELYCLDIEYVEEIVREESVTRVPNTAAYVSGVVDLRGQITTILDPKTTIGIERSDDDQLIVVFDAELFDDHGAIGWLVDEVNQVTPIVEEEVKESPIQEPYINGVIERDDEFVIWTTPELALDADTEV